MVCIISPSANDNRFKRLNIGLGDLNTLGGFPELEDVTFHYRSHYVDRGITSGIELCTLPQGEQLRLDLLER